MDSVRTAISTIGTAELKPSAEEMGTLPFRKSLFVVRDIKAGEVFTAENIRSIRPAHGMHPRHYENLLGKKASVDIDAGSPLQVDMIER